MWGAHHNPPPPPSPVLLNVDVGTLILKVLVQFHPPMVPCFHVRTTGLTHSMPFNPPAPQKAPCYGVQDQPTRTLGRR